MSVRLCAICESPILKGEPRKQIAGQELIHAYCDLDYDSNEICDNTACEWWRTTHAGPCVT